MTCSFNTNTELTEENAAKSSDHTHTHTHKALFIILLLSLSFHGTQTWAQLRIQDKCVTLKKSLVTDNFKTIFFKFYDNIKRNLKLMEDIVFWAPHKRALWRMTTLQIHAKTQWRQCCPLFIMFFRPGQNVPSAWQIWQWFHQHALRFQCRFAQIYVCVCVRERANDSSVSHRCQKMIAQTYKERKSWERRERCRNEAHVLYLQLGCNVLAQAW